MTLPATFGETLRYWRQARRWTQLELSLEAGISSRHLSFLETGRARPSREMVLLLGEVLGVSLRDRNVLLESAGFAAAYRVRTLEDPALGAIASRLQFLLDRMHPYPAMLFDRHWNILEQNQAAAVVLPHFIAKPEQLQPPLNIMRLLFDEAGTRPFVTNWSDVASAMIQRLHREAAAAPTDEPAQKLLADCLGTAGIPGSWRAPDLERLHEPLVPIKLRRDAVALELFTVILSIGTPQDVALQELRLETFMPIDDASEATLEELIARATES